MTDKFCQQFHKALIDVMKSEGLWRENLRSELPKKGIWEVYGDLILFGQQHFLSDAWRKPGTRIWEAVAKVFQLKRVARIRGEIKNDGFRSPNIEILLPGNGSTMVRMQENKIKYQWDITKCMYSSGNTSEKLRIAEWDLTDQVVVDMYAGIGYFALPYLVHANVRKLYAIDWNPAAIEALRENLVFNKVEDRCVVIEGDSSKVCPEGVADHVNLGLLPDSEVGYIAACRALNKVTGGVLHIHGCADLKSNLKRICDEDKRKHANTPKSTLAHCAWSAVAQAQINHILPKYCGGTWITETIWIHKVKSYGPNVDHVVLDLQCTPVLIPDHPHPVLEEKEEHKGKENQVVPVVPKPAVTNWRELVPNYSLDQLIADVIEVTLRRKAAAEAKRWKTK